MEEYNANNIWRKVVKSLEKEDVILKEALSRSKVTQTSNDKWEIEIMNGLGIFQKSVIFDNKDVICQLLSSEYNVNVDIQFYDKNDNKDQYDEQMEMIMDVLRKCIKDNEIVLNTIQKVVFSKIFICVLEIIKGDIEVYDLMDNFFKYYKLHNIKYYKGEKFINIFVTLSNKKEFSNLTHDDIHFIAFFYYYTIYDLDLEFSQLVFEQKVLAEKQELLKLYEKYKYDDKYFIEEEKKEKYKNIDEYMDELESMIGLENIKIQIESIINLMMVRQLRKESKIPQTPITLHMIFKGNPGTGKTTIARLLANIFREIGVLKKGHLVEASRVNLVGEHIGETAIKTKEVVEEALDGILFIDEAYSLTRDLDGGRDYGNEAIETLIKLMEDYRDRLIVIAAGYNEQMDQFLNSNPGVKSRFKQVINFENYRPEELIQIFIKMCNDYNFKVEENALEYVKNEFMNVYSDLPEDFGNGREIRNFFDSVQIKQANRLSNYKKIDKESLCTITIDDVKGILKEKNNAKRRIGF